jgi:hypothetical protein
MGCFPVDSRGAVRGRDIGNLDGNSERFEGGRSIFGLLETSASTDDLCLPVFWGLHLRFPERGRVGHEHNAVMQAIDVTGTRDVMLGADMKKSRWLMGPTSRPSHFGGVNTRFVRIQQAIPLGGIQISSNDNLSSSRRQRGEFDERGREEDDSPKMINIAFAHPHRSR